ncbi:MAG: pilus assembly protein PilM, partial [Patescibacteria group bacterium]|nr:pilus assembly protein PilM [Patescibacteria group bacterium]
MFNIFKSKKVLGIDLGSRDIKIVEVEKYKNSFILNNYIIIELEGGEKISSLLETSQIYEEHLAKIIENGLKEFKPREVVYSVPSLYYFYTNFSLPYIPVNALKNAVNFEYRKYLPVSYEKFQIEWRNVKYSPFNLEGQDKWFI